MRYLLNILLFNFVYLNLFAQTDPIAETKREGDVAFICGQYSVAFEKYSKALDSFPDNYYLQSMKKFSHIFIDSSKNYNEALTDLNIPSTTKFSPIPVKLNIRNQLIKVCRAGNNSSIIYSFNNDENYTIYQISKEGNKWRAPKKIFTFPESDPVYFLSSVSFDGKRIYFTKYDKLGSTIFISNLIGSRWDDLKIVFPKDDLNYINAHAFESNDGKTLFFASNRPGGFGGMDIYKCEYIGKDLWGPAVNLGDSINTDKDEDVPVWNAENNILSFSSTGYDSQGGYDIFFSQYENGNYRKPVNAGVLYNSETDNYYDVPVSQLIGFIERNYIQTAFKSNNPKDYLAEIVEKKEVPMAVVKNVDTFTNAVPENKVDTFSKEVAINKVDTINTPVIDKKPDILSNQISIQQNIIDTIKPQVFVQVMNTTDKGNFYTIQLTANKGTIDFTRFKDIPDLVKWHGNDGYTRCTSGEFKNIHDAYTKMLFYINSGYKDAFVRKISNIPGFE
jgi:hypothetical protein